MSHKKYLFIMFILSIFLNGCGDNLFSNLSDNSSKDAKLEDGKIALDKGDYTSARNTFEEICGSPKDLKCDDTEKSLYASAYMGIAGIDVVKIISEIDQITSKKSGKVSFKNNNPVEAFNIFKNLINPKHIDALQNAIDILDSIKNRIPDQELQLAVATVSHMVASIIDKTIVGTFDPDNAKLAVFDPNKVDDDLLKLVQDDIDILVKSIDKVTKDLGEELDISKVIKDIKSDIESSSTEGTIAGTIELIELKSYLTKLNPA